jgi:NADP-dependent 3-hydroxy acid dehydrogenase YdfG
VQGKLQDRVAIVFGAGSVGEGWGNGKASAVAYARAGAKVACVDMNEAAAQATAEIIKGQGGEAIAVRANVTDLDEVRAATDAAVKAYGRLDVLHSNVGITAAGGPVEASEESWDRVMNVNVKSMFFTCKCALPIMVDQGRGAIVNISSLAGIRWTGYNYSSYYASKAAVKCNRTQVLLRVRAAGVYHSDLHIWKGSYDLGFGRRMSLKDRIRVPLTLGQSARYCGGPGGKGGATGRGAPRLSLDRMR